MRALLWMYVFSVTPAAGNSTVHVTVCSSRTREQHFVNAPQCFVTSKEQYRESTLRMFRKSTKAVSRILMYLSVSYRPGGGIVKVPERSVTDFIERAWQEYLSVLWLTSLKEHDKSTLAFCNWLHLKKHDESTWVFCDWLHWRRMTRVPEHSVTHFSEGAWWELVD